MQYLALFAAFMLGAYAGLEFTCWRIRRMMASGRLTVKENYK